MPLPYISADLKWKVETVRERFVKLLEKGYINYDFDAEIVLINNFLKYNALENPNQVSGAIKALELIPVCALDQKLIDTLNCYKLVMCAGKKEDYTNRYETLMQTVAQRVTSTVTVAVAVSVNEKESGTVGSCAEQECSAPPSAPPQAEEATPPEKKSEHKKKYGTEFGLVKLTDAEHEKLISRLGKARTLDYIDRLDGWLAEGNSKKSHYATILNWWKKDYPDEASKGGVNSARGKKPDFKPSRQ